MDGDKVLGVLIVFNVIYMCSGSGCQGMTMIRAGGLTAYDKKLIVNVHNNYRSAVALGHINGQPMGQNIMEMQWDDELAAKAQQWAEQCIFGHDPNRHIGRFQVGQNIAATWTTRVPVDYRSTEPDFPTQIQKWFEEVKNYDFKNHVFSASTGHYTQVVWSDSTLIGCGFSYYFDPHMGYTKVYVCNYGPAGNVYGEAPYIPGAPSCNTFGLAPSARHSGLCDKNYLRFVFNNFLAKDYKY